MPVISLLHESDFNFDQFGRNAPGFCSRLRKKNSQKKKGEEEEKEKMKRRNHCECIEEQQQRKTKQNKTKQKENERAQPCYHERLHFLLFAKES